MLYPDDSQERDRPVTGLTRNAERREATRSWWHDLVATELRRSGAAVTSVRGLRRKHFRVEGTFKNTTPCGMSEVLRRTGRQRITLPDATVTRRRTVESFTSLMERWLNLC